MASTVIEVGVDVPNATLMVIDHAERMGLSQLHQLRGRVGRGAARSTCILLYQHPLTQTAARPAEDHLREHGRLPGGAPRLELRGPGELLGARQSGVPLLRFADLATDGRAARRCAGSGGYAAARQSGGGTARISRAGWDRGAITSRSEAPWRVSRDRRLVKSPRQHAARPRCCDESRAMPVYRRAVRSDLR